MNTETAPRPPPPPLILSLTSPSSTTAVSPASTSTTAPKAPNSNLNSVDGTSLSEALAQSVANYVCANTQQHRKSTVAGRQGGASPTTQQPLPANVVSKSPPRQTQTSPLSGMATISKAAAAAANESPAADVHSTTTTPPKTAAAAAVTTAGPAAKAATPPPTPSALPSTSPIVQCESHPGETAPPNAPPNGAAAVPPPPERVVAAAPSTPRTAPTAPTPCQPPSAHHAPFVQASRPSAPPASSLPGSPSMHDAPRTPEARCTHSTLPDRAPIISGTAAAILALQTVSFDHHRVAPAVVSTCSSYSGGGGSEECACHGGRRVDGCLSSSSNFGAGEGSGRSVEGNSPSTPATKGPSVVGTSLDSETGRCRNGIGNDCTACDSTARAAVDGTGNATEKEPTIPQSTESSATKAACRTVKVPTVSAASRTSSVPFTTSSPVVAVAGPATSSTATATATAATATSKKPFPSRYSDGAPIIAGTAAAQMAIATAARIAASRRDGFSGVTASISSALGAMDMTLNMNMTMNMNVNMNMNATATARDVTVGTSVSRTIADTNRYNFSEDMSQFGSAMEKLSSLGKSAIMDNGNDTSNSVHDTANTANSANTANTHIMTNKNTEVGREFTLNGVNANGPSNPHGMNRTSTMAVSSPPPARKGVKSSLLSKSTSCQSKKNTPTKALSWVDHAPRVTPEDFSANHRHSASKRTASSALCEDSGSGSAVSSLPPRHLSTPSHSRQVKNFPSEHHRIPAAPTPSASTAHGASSSAPSPGGGMDILADIISHVPPMIVPVAQRQSPSTLVPVACHSVTSANPGHPPLQSSQQLQQQTLHQSKQYSPQHLHQQHQPHHQHQQQQQLLHHTQYSSGQPTSSEPFHYRVHTAQHTKITHRVSAIPSYQEIYQEMRQMEQSAASHPHQPANQCHYTPMEVDEPAPATTSDAMQQHYPSQPQHLQYYSQEPTSVREPTVIPSCTSYTVEEVPISIPCEVETVEPPPPSKTIQRPPTTHFGHAEGGEIVEGKELYTRKDLAIAGGHALEHKDVHGNMKEGADSIVVSHLERDLREGDGLCWLLFSCDRTNGGGALCRSYYKKRAIRVFRSSLLGGRFAAPYLDEEEDDEIGYRYDGLYMVKAVWDVNGNETESFPTTGVEGWQTFFFTRLPKKPLDAKDVEPGMQYNQLGLQELWGSIQKMRGVKRPKKFEIPAVPAKLPPFKRAAITGENKDRKATAYKPPPKPEPKQVDDQESDHVILNGKNHPHSRQSNSVECCHSSEDDTSKNAEEEKPHSETSHQHSQHVSQHSDTEKMPKRLSMSRPRMLCIPDPASESNHRKRGEAHNDVDSSDSDESSSHIQERKKSPSTKRKKPDQPLASKVSTPSKKSDVLVDTSSYFPKRTSAAKAEAANRDLLTKPKKPNNKRKSAPSNSRGERKKAKKAVEEEEVDDYSSEEELIDQEALTVGSRVLVTYKGSLFKATIRKRREKNGRHDFLIHYDGNKKSNVHWVPIDRIPEIISLAVRATPSKKNAPKRKEPSAKKSSSRRSSNDDDSSDDENKENELSPRESRSSQEADLESEESQGIGGVCATEESNSSSNEIASSIENTLSVEKSEANRVDRIQKPADIGTDSVTRDCSASVNRVSPDDHSSPNTNFTTVGSSSEQSKVEESTTQGSSSRTFEILPDQTASNNTPSDCTSPAVSTDIICVAEPNDKLSRPHFPVESTSDELNGNNRSSNSSDIASLEKRENDSSGKSSTLSSIADDDEASADGVEEPSSNCSDQISNDAAKAQIDGVKFPLGSKVYVEYRHIFYSSTILKTRKKRAAYEYLVHYQGYKKASNRWVKEDTLHEVNEATTKRFEEQRLIPADILYGTDQTEFSMVTRRKKAAEEFNLSPSKSKPRGSRIDISELADLGDIEPGVAFLPGSVVFVEWSGALYLAKMLKKRFSGDRMEYMVSYDGFESSFDAWVSIHKIYEVDHQSKKVFKRLKSDMLPQPPPGPKRETRSSFEAEALAAPTPKRESRRKKDDESVSDFDLSSKANGEVRQVESQIDMQGIPSGVEFLPGSTLFAERNRGLCLAKMLKKRGKGDYMEYFIQYMGLKKEETRWISTALVFEINPQTKRMYRLYSGKKK